MCGLCLEQKVAEKEGRRGRRRRREPGIVYFKNLQLPQFNAFQLLLANGTLNEKKPANE